MPTTKGFRTVEQPEKLNSANEAALNSCSMSVIIYCERPYADYRFVEMNGFLDGFKLNGMRAGGRTSREDDNGRPETHSNYN